MTILSLYNLNRPFNFIKTYGTWTITTDINTYGRYAQCKTTTNDIMKYPHTDTIKAVLRNKADFVQQGGLNYLIPNWQQFAEEYVENEGSIYEWLNHLDVRKTIDDILAALPEDERYKIELELKPIDEKVMVKTFEINECLWDDKVEQENAYNRQQNWYYYRMNQHVFESETGQYTKRF